MSKVSIASIFTTAAVVISETPNFELKFNFLERLKKPLNLRSTREKREKRKTETICRNNKPRVYYQTRLIQTPLLFTLKKMAEIASLEGKISNTTGRKTAIQALRGKFDPLEISELTGHADPCSIASYSHNSKSQQRRMSNILAGFTPSSDVSDATATTRSDNRGSPNI